MGQNCCRVALSVFFCSHASGSGVGKCEHFLPSPGGKSHCAHFRGDGSCASPKAQQEALRGLSMKKEQRLREFLRVTLGKLG